MDDVGVVGKLIYDFLIPLYCDQCPIWYSLARIAGNMYFPLFCVGGVVETLVLGEGVELHG